MTLSKKDLLKINKESTKALVFDDRGFVLSDIKQLVTWLNDAKHITSLSLKHNNLDDQAALELAKLKYIKRLTLSHNDIYGPEAVKALVSNNRIKELFLDTNNLSPKVVPIILQHATQHILNINGNNKIEKEARSKII